MLTPNPFLGIIFHSVGGLAAATCLIPSKWIRKWSWETYWVLNVLCGCVLAPWVVGFAVCPRILEVLATAPRSSMLWCYIFGGCWGIGNLCFGLTVRYLGWSLGYAMSLGFCAAFGTLVPPIAHGQIVSIVASTSGLTTLAGIAVCLGGIAMCGRAGVFKERELSADEKTASIAEFNFGKGVWVAVFAGIMSGFFAVALDVGKPIAQTAVDLGASPAWKMTVVCVPLLAGGFTVNLLCCMYLGVRNGTIGEYTRGKGVDLARDALLAASIGVIWYHQFMFYSLGTTRMGRYDFCSLSIHIAFIIMCSNLWGLSFHEWKGTSRSTRAFVVLGLLVLASSTAIMGLGNYIAMRER